MIFNFKKYSQERFFEDQVVKAIHYENIDFLIKNKEEILKIFNSYILFSMPYFIDYLYTVDKYIDFSQEPLFFTIIENYANLNSKTFNTKNSITNSNHLLELSDKTLSLLLNTWFSKCTPSYIYKCLKFSAGNLSSKDSDKIFSNLDEKYKIITNASLDNHMDEEAFGGVILKYMNFSKNLWREHPDKVVLDLILAGQCQKVPHNLLTKEFFLEIANYMLLEESFDCIPKEFYNDVNFIGEFTNKLASNRIVEFLINWVNNNDITPEFFTSILAHILKFVKKYIPNYTFPEIIEKYLEKIILYLNKF